MGLPRRPRALQRVSPEFEGSAAASELTTDKPNKQMLIRMHICLEEELQRSGLVSV